MKIQSDLDNGNYKKMQEIMRKRGMTEYQLVQDAVLIYVNEEEISRQKSIVYKIMKIIDWIDKDLHLEG